MTAPPDACRVGRARCRRPNRHDDRSVYGQSSYFVRLNRGKESLELDLTDTGDRTLLDRILARADVLVQDLAPGAADRAGLGAATLRAGHPRLVHCSISGYGPTARTGRAQRRSPCGVRH